MAINPPEERVCSFTATPILHAALEVGSRYPASPESVGTRRLVFQFGWPLGSFIRCELGCRIMSGTGCIWAVSHQQLNQPFPVKDVNIIPGSTFRSYCKQSGMQSMLGAKIRMKQRQSRVRLVITVYLTYPIQNTCTELIPKSAPELVTPLSATRRPDCPASARFSRGPFRCARIIFP